MHATDKQLLWQCHHVTTLVLSQMQAPPTRQPALVLAPLPRQPAPVLDQEDAEMAVAVECSLQDMQIMPDSRRQHGAGGHLWPPLAANIGHLAVGAPANRQASFCQLSLAEVPYEDCMLPAAACLPRLV